MLVSLGEQRIAPCVLHWLPDGTWHEPA